MITPRVEVGPSRQTRAQMIGTNQSGSANGLLKPLASGDAP
jgi:hypothetical protein